MIFLQVPFATLEDIFTGTIYSTCVEALDVDPNNSPSGAHFFHNEHKNALIDSLAEMISNLHQGNKI